MADVAVQLVATVEDLGSQGAGHLAHGRAGQIAVLGYLENHALPPRLLVAETPGHFPAHARIGAVHDGGYDLAPLLLQGIDRQPDGADDLIRGPAVRSRDQEDGAAEVAADLGIDVELQGRHGAGEIGPLAENEVALVSEEVIFPQDSLVDLLFPASGDEFFHLFHRTTVHFLVGELQGKMRRNESGVVVPSVPKTRLRHDGAKEADPVDLAQEHFHHSQGDGRLAAPRLGCSEVKVAGHGPSTVQRLPFDFCDPGWQSFIVCDESSPSNCLTIFFQYCQKSNMMMINRYPYSTLTPDWSG